MIQIVIKIRGNPASKSYVYSQLVHAAKICVS